MRWLILSFVLLLFSFSSAFGEESIAGGETSEYIPWMVRVESGYVKCSGFLVGQEWVITAEHCTKTVPLLLTIGEYRLDNFDGEITVFSSSFVTFYRDVALVHLPIRVFTPHLEIADSVDFSVTATVYGWGLLSDYAAPNLLQKAIQRLEAHGEDIIFRPVTSGKVTNGDSGGPLVQGNKIIGLTSYLYGQEGGLGKNLTIIKTEIISAQVNNFVIFFPWIAEGKVNE